MSISPTESPILDASQIRRRSCTPSPFGEIFQDASNSDCIDFLGDFKALSAIVDVFEAMVASWSSVLAKDHKMLVCSAKWQNVSFEIALFVLNVS